MPSTNLRLMVLRQFRDQKLNAFLVKDAPTAVEDLLKEQPTDCDAPTCEFFQEVPLTEEQQEAILFLRRMERAEEEPLHTSRWIRYVSDLFNDMLEQEGVDCISIASLCNPADRKALQDILCDAERTDLPQCVRAGHLSQLCTALKKLRPAAVTA